MAATQYAIQPSTYLKEYARFETKPHDESIEGSDSAGGYERFRSHEFRPDTAKKGKESVFVSHHRLLAVIACYPDDMPIGEILEHMDGKDIHHNAPEVDGSRGVEWDNRPDCLFVRDHGGHSSITQSEMRAWGEDAKREVEIEFDEEREIDPDRCDGCDEQAKVFVSPEGSDSKYCPECGKAASNGRTLEVI